MTKDGRVHRLRWGGRHAWVLIKRIAVGIIGGIVTAVGIVLCLTPGPGVLVLLLGLTILATEFPWARRTLTRAHRKMRAVKRRWEMTRRVRRGSRRDRPGGPPGRSSARALRPQNRGTAGGDGSGAI
ncbi:MAG: PGPGW domain-containing protein [Egibacteraceae bacterium]